MRGYRCFFLDLGGHVVDMAVIECDGDTRALSEGSERLQLTTFAAAEIWQRDRLIGRLAREKPSVA